MTETIKIQSKEVYPLMQKETREFKVLNALCSLPSPYGLSSIQIIQLSGLGRATVYSALPQLIKNDLITKEEKEGHNPMYKPTKKGYDVHTALALAPHIQSKSSNITISSSSPPCSDNYWCRSSHIASASVTPVKIQTDAVIAPKNQGEQIMKEVRSAIEDIRKKHDLDSLYVASLIKKETPQA